jgi:hypothetical protein
MNKRKTLDELAAQINAEHDECIAAFKRGLDHAMRAGDLLIQAKALVGHGKWMPWFRKHCPRMSERTAQVYMRLARHRAQVESAGPAGLTIDSVLATLAWPSGWDDDQPELPTLPPRTRAPKWKNPPLTKETEEDRRRNEERRERLRQKEAAEIARFKRFFVDNPKLNDFHGSGIGYHWAIAFGRQQCKFVDAVGLVTIYEAASPEQQQKLRDHLAPRPSVQLVAENAQRTAA